jgi:GT2 family glycosyltransferase
VVSVDGSTDGTCEMLDAFVAPYPLRWTWHPNSGRAAACNRGIELARGDLIVILDDDMEPVPELLDAHAAEHPAGTRRAVMGAVPIVIDGPPTAIAEYVRRKFERHLERLGGAGQRFVLRDFYSGNLSIARSELIEVGGFDEEFTIYGNEDLELSWRLRLIGVELAFSGAAMAYQHYAKDIATVARENIAKGRTAVLLATKHAGALAQLKIGPAARARFVRRKLTEALLAITKRWPSTSTTLIELLRPLDRLPAPGIHRVYTLMLDYFYFVGASAAQEELAHKPQASFQWL